MTMRKFVLTVCGILALYALQTSILPLIAYHGVTADLMLLFVASTAFLRGARIGAFVGFCVGLMEDLASGTFLGMNALSRLLLGYAVGSGSASVFKDQMVLPVFSSIFVTAANYFILAVLMVLLGYRFSLLGHVQYTLLPMLVYQFLFAYPVHRMVCRGDKWLRVKR